MPKRKRIESEDENENEKEEKNSSFVSKLKENLQNSEEEDDLFFNNDDDESDESNSESESDSEEDIDFYSSSDDDAPENRIGNIPLEWYDEHDHIGYNVDGKKVLRGEKKDEIDDYLDKTDDPDYWRTIRDDKNGKSYVLSRSEWKALRNIQKGRTPSTTFDPYQPFFDFPGEDTIHPLSNAPEPKSRFVPSKWEHKKILKLASAIRRGDIKLEKEKKIKEKNKFFMLWDDSNENQTNNKNVTLAPPERPTPKHSESYNPSPEFLFDEAETESWKDLDPEDRVTNYLPKKYDNLRSVPYYSESFTEGFARCLDLYLCPRVPKAPHRVKSREDLLPILPQPNQLKPFPNIESIVYKSGSNCVVRTICILANNKSVQPWAIATGNDNGIVHIFEIQTSRCIKRINLVNIKKNLEDEEEESSEEEEPHNDSDEEKPPKPPKQDSSLTVSNVIHSITSNPKHNFFAVSLRSTVYFISSIFDENNENSIQNEENEENDENEENKDKVDRTPKNETDLFFKKLLNQKKNGKGFVKWSRPTDQEYKVGIRLKLTHKSKVGSIVFHSGGDYVGTLTHPNTSKSSANTALIHQLSYQGTQSPFPKQKGGARIQAISFHPTKPHFIIATQKLVKIYDLVKQCLWKKLTSGVRHISSLDVHPMGDNLIISSYDKRLCWFDLELSTKPYRVMRYHKYAIRKVAFHPKYPIFASCSDDLTIQIFHGMVYDDLLKNPLIVPCKILRGHQVKNDVGVLDIKFHPTLPWLFSSGADGTVRLWTNL